MGSDAPRLKLVASGTHERSADLRLPFRFGVATLTRATQTVLTVRIALEDGRTALGHAAESLLPKWFDKSLALTDEENMAQLRASVAIALGLYEDAGLGTAFGLSARIYSEQRRICGAQGLNPLVASYGPALVDRAILDALGRCLGMSFADMIRGNRAGIESSALAPDLAGFDLPAFLGALAPSPTIAVRHTVGLLDPLTDVDLSDRRADGLPETLADVVQCYGCRYYKIKVGGDLAADLDRLARIASVLEASDGYRCTLDGNEQYDDVEGITELWRRLKETPGPHDLARATLWIEQPIKRGVALERRVSSLSEDIPLMIDESDSGLESFPDAIALGYRGVSSKNCKGFYKSILNSARAAQRNAQSGGGHFLSAEDLSTWAGLSTQQDLALVSLLGLTHVERNGHHYMNGMSVAPEAEQAAYLRAHPDLYDRAPGQPARLKIRGGDIALGSLNGPGFGCSVAPESL